MNLSERARNETLAALKHMFTPESAKIILAAEKGEDFIEFNLYTYDESTRIKFYNFLTNEGFKWEYNRNTHVVKVFW